MNKKTNKDDSPQEFFVPSKTREEILSEITEITAREPLPAVEKKTLAIPPASTKADFEKIAKDLNVGSDTIVYRILKLFCDKKPAQTVDARTLIKRIQNFSDEQLKILELICAGQDFTVSNILKFIPLIKKFENYRLLALRAFVELEGVGDGPLNRFFTATFPQSTRKEMGDEAYENELREKAMRHDQVNVFYNICYRLSGITPTTAIAILIKTRQLKQQHAQVINTFLTKDVYFNNEPINDSNILRLLNLWLSLPEIDDEKKFQQLIKKLSRKSDKQKNDFHYLIQSFKEKTEPSKDNMASRLSNFFN